MDTTSRKKIEKWDARWIGTTDAGQRGKVYLSHIKEICRWFNKALREAEIPITVDASLVEQGVRTLISDDRVNDFILAQMQGKDIPGTIHEEQVKTVVEIFKSIFIARGNPVLVLGAMQCGKTGTSNAVHFIGPIFYVLTRGKCKYYPITQLTQRKGHADQTIDEFDRFCALYGQLLFKRMDLDITLEQYSRKAMQLHEPQENASTFQEYRTGVMNQAVRLHLRQAEPDLRSRDIFARLMRERIRKNIEGVKSLCTAARKDGFTVAFIIDEPHWGSKKNGVQFKMMEELVEDMQDVSKGHIFIAFDATPFAISHAEKVSVVRHRLSPEYCGPNFWMGDYIDPSVETRLPLVKKLNEFAQEINCPGFEYISRTYYTNESRFNTLKKNKWVGSWDDYRKSCAKSMRKAIQSLLLEERRGITRGVCIRWLKSNDETDSFVRNELRLNKKIKSIFYSAERAQISVKERIANDVGDGEVYVVWVTGAARMADAFPDHCTHFIDFTDRITDVSALLQGSYGRACGYGKESTVIMNERNIAWIGQYIASQGAYHKKLPKNCIQEASAGRLKQNVTIFSDQKKDCRVAAVFRHFQKEIFDKLPVGTVVGRAAMRDISKSAEEVLSPTYFKDGFFRIYDKLDCSFFDYLEQNYSTIFPTLREQPRIVRPEANTGHGRLSPPHNFTVDLHETDKRFGAIGLRSFDSRRMLRSATNTLNRMGLGEGRKVQPQFWMKVENGRWKLHSIVLRLREGVLEASTQDEVIAQEFDGYHDFHGDDQRRRALMHHHEQLVKRGENRIRRGALPTGAQKNGLTFDENAELLRLTKESRQLHAISPVRMKRRAK